MTTVQKLFDLYEVQEDHNETFLFRGTLNSIGKFLHLRRGAMDRIERETLGPSDCCDLHPGYRDPDGSLYRVRPAVADLGITTYVR